MKSINKIFHIIALSLAGGLMLTSCEGDQAVPPMPLPEGLYNQDHVIGKGTWEVPLTCYQARIGTCPDGMTDNVWVSGYIVGWVNSDISATMKQESAIFSAPSSVKSNILLSDYTPAELEQNFVEKDEEGNIVSDTRWEHAVPVQLVYDTDPRPALNLGDNPLNLGKRVSVMGQTNVKYFGVYSVKFTSAYNWGEQGKYIAPPVAGTFVAVDRVEDSDWYLIAYEKNVAKTFDAPNSYLKTSEVTPINATTFKLKDMYKYAFYLSAAEGGPGNQFSIRMNNGLFLGISGTKKDFYTSESPSTFTINPGADGTFIIKASNGSQMMYDTEFGSFGLYLTLTSNHHAPKLYRLVK